jgi:hypothetical protein
METKVMNSLKQATSTAAHNLNIMLEPTFYTEYQLLSRNSRKDLKFHDRIFVNGRFYNNITSTNPKSPKSFWCLGYFDLANPYYFLPQLPHVIAKEPSDLLAEFARLKNYFQTFDSIETAYFLAGLTVHDGPYPRGGFATSTEYERYVSLYTGGRAHEVPAYLAALPGAPVFNARDPYPHGHCYLILLPHDKQAKHYREGQDFLTKEILERIWPDINRNRIICYELRAADAHLSLDKRPGANQILVTCGELADKLRDAFVDGICDHEELTDIYYTTPLVNRQ